MACSVNWFIFVWYSVINLIWIVLDSWIKTSATFHRHWKKYNWKKLFANAYSEERHLTRRSSLRKKRFVKREGHTFDHHELHRFENIGYDDQQLLSFSYCFRFIVPFRSHHKCRSVRFDNWSRTAKKKISYFHQRDLAACRLIFNHFLFCSFDCFKLYIRCSLVTPEISLQNDESIRFHQRYESDSHRFEWFTNQHLAFLPHIAIGQDPLSAQNRLWNAAHQLMRFVLLRVIQF